MSKKLNSTVGAMNYDGLVYDDKFPIDTKTVSLRAGQGELKCGTVLAVSTTSEDYVKVGITPVENETFIADCILADDVDTTGAVSVIGEAYRSGHFNANNLFGTLNENDKRALTANGIYLSN